MSPLDALMWLLVAIVAATFAMFVVAFVVVARRQMNQTEIGEELYRKLMDDMGKES